MKLDGFPIDPIYDNVIVEKTEEAVSSGGVLLPPMKDRMKEGVVVACGPGWYLDGKLIPTSVKPGDKVYVKEFGYRFNFRNKDYYLFKSSDIIGVIVG